MCGGSAWLKTEMSAWHLRALCFVVYSVVDSCKQRKSFVKFLSLLFSLYISPPLPAPSQQVGSREELCAGSESINISLVLIFFIRTLGALSASAKYKLYWRAVRARSAAWLHEIDTAPPTPPDPTPPILSFPFPSLLISSQHLQSTDVL